MSVIIRLQNLPLTANSLDIRHFFRGLSIPEGGVHIVGGELGDAFIAFSTDEDARQAMMLGGGKIKEVQITLMLSSRNEMQKVIEAARQVSMTTSLATLLGTATPLVVPNVPGLPLLSLAQQNLPRRDSKEDKKDSSDISSSSHEASGRRDRKDDSRSRSRDRSRNNRRDRDRDRERDRDRDRDRRKRSRSRSRSRDRRRRRTRSRSRGRDMFGRDRDRREVKDDSKKDKEAGLPPVTSAPDLVVSTTLPNLEVLNTNQWGGIPALSQANPILSRLTEMGLLRNLAGQANALQAAQLPILNQEPIPADNLSPRKDSNFMNRDFERRGDSGERILNNRNFQRDTQMDNNRFDNKKGNFKNFEENASGNFQRFGNDDNRFNRNRQPNAFGGRQNNGNAGGFQQRNNNDQNRFGNNDNSNFPPSLLGNRPNQNQDRFNNRGRFREGESVDEFGRNVQLRNRRSTSNDSGMEDDNFQNRAQAAFPFASRFMQNQQSAPSPLLPSRESWPPGKANQRNENFQERRNFQDRNNFRNDNSRFANRRNDFKIDNRSQNEDKEMEENLNSNRKPSEKGCCIEIRGLAPSTTYGDIRKPFSNQKILIKEIKFFDYTGLDKKCRVKFLSVDGKMKALQSNNKISVDGKLLQLVPCSDSDFDNISDERVRRGDPKFSDDEDDVVALDDTCIMVKDLPLNVTKIDIENFFKGAPLDKILIEKEGKSKTAYVRFLQAVDAKNALHLPNRSIGDIRLVLLPLSHKQFDKKCENISKLETDDEIMNAGNENSQNSSIDDHPNNFNSPTSGSDCILVKNLPYEANDRDICDFFSDIGLVPTRIHIMLDVDNEPSGDAFCEFSHPDQALKACTKNGMPMGKNSLTLEQVPRSEMLDALGISNEGQSLPSKQPSKPQPLLQNNPLEHRKQPLLQPDPPGPNTGFGKPNCVVALENIPFRAGSFEIIKFFGWSYKLKEDDIMRRYNDRGQPTGDARVCFKSPEDAQKAIRFFNNKQIQGRAIRMKLL